MKYFLSDSRLSNRFTARERSKLLTGLQDIKHYIDNDTIDDDDKKYVMEANYFNRFSGVVKTLDDISIFDNKIRLQGMKRSLYNKLRDWGRGRKGIPTGLISKNINTVYNDKQQCYELVDVSDDNKKPNIEHIIPISLFVEMTIQDYISGRWNFDEKKDFVTTDSNIEDFYSLQILTTIVTREENLLLEKIKNQMYKKFVNPYTGQPDARKIVEEMSQGYHYKEAKISFHNEVMSLPKQTLAFNETPEGIKELMGKRKFTPRKQNHDFW